MLHIFMVLNKSQELRLLKKKIHLKPSEDHNKTDCFFLYSSGKVNLSVMCGLLDNNTHCAVIKEWETFKHPSKHIQDSQQLVSVRLARSVNTLPDTLYRRPGV